MRLAEFQKRTGWGCEMACRAAARGWFSGQPIPRGSGRYRDYTERDVYIANAIIEIHKTVDPTKSRDLLSKALPLLRDEYEGLVAFNFIIITPSHICTTATVEEAAREILDARMRSPLEMRVVLNIPLLKQLAVP